MTEAQRKAKAVGQAHSVKEYKIHDAILKSQPTLGNDSAWRITMSLPAKARGRKAKR